MIWYKVLTKRKCGYGSYKEDKMSEQLKICYMVL